MTRNSKAVKTGTCEYLHTLYATSADDPQRSANFTISL